jgi:hypothetical protein
MLTLNNTFVQRLPIISDRVTLVIIHGDMDRVLKNRLLRGVVESSEIRVSEDLLTRRSAVRGEAEELREQVERV